ncbi:tRNA (adenine(22)-N(1))-methyltransferase TrmK [Candidatus Micrarchaeota archaeon]|nr:tRNA (adenine(22)-N(1))-methyltransferase TrmK [Candidatus Micrarchaeota archaeon]
MKLGVFMLTGKELREVTQRHQEMQEQFRTVSIVGKEIEYLGKKFLVFKTVFWPFEDSVPLVENFVVRSEESVLDVGTGSGVIAIFSVYKGAKRIVAIDINPWAVKCARENAKRHGFSDRIEVRKSDLFEAIKENEKFDVITANLPFRNKVATDFVEATVWDTRLRVNKTFFKQVGKYLNSSGRIYLSNANFGSVREMKRLAGFHGFKVKKIGQKKMPGGDPRIFFAFELTRK